MRLAYSRLHMKYEKKKGDDSGRNSKAVVKHCTNNQVIQKYRICSSEQLNGKKQHNTNLTTLFAVTFLGQLQLT